MFLEPYTEIDCNSTYSHNEATDVPGLLKKDTVASKNLLMKHLFRLAFLLYAHVNFHQVYPYVLPLLFLFNFITF